MQRNVLAGKKMKCSNDGKNFAKNSIRKFCYTQKKQTNIVPHKIKESKNKIKVYNARVCAAMMFWVHQCGFNTKNSHRDF